MEYIVGGKKLIWDFDKTNNDASKLIDNNLYIDGVWNMKDTLEYTDTCVGLKILSDTRFKYFTFYGTSLTMDVVGNRVCCIKKEFTK